MGRIMLISRSISRSLDSSRDALHESWFQNNLDHILGPSAEYKPFCSSAFRSPSDWLHLTKSKFKQQMEGTGPY